MLMRPTHSRVIMPAVITGRDSTARYSAMRGPTAAWRAISGPFSGSACISQTCHKRLMHRSKRHLYSITSSARLSNVAGISMPSALAVLSGVSNRVLNFPLGRIARFGSTSSVRSNAGKPRTSSPSWHLPILRSYSSKSWLVPRFSLQIYCTAKAVGKALPLAAIVPQMLMTTLQERLMPKLSSSCPFVVSLAPRSDWRTYS